MAKRDIMVILSLAPTYRTRYGNDAYLYHKASEKHKMMAQDNSRHRQIFACDKQKMVVVVAVFSWFLRMFALLQVIFKEKTR